MARRRRAARIRAIGQNQAGQPHSRAEYRAAPEFKGDDIGHGIVIEIKLPRVDQIHKCPRRQMKAADCIAQGRSQRIALDFATLLPLQAVTPPLQPDFTGHRLRNLVANHRHVQRESMQRRQMRTLVCRGKQVAQPLIPVIGPQQAIAMGVSRSQ